MRPIRKTGDPNIVLADAVEKLRKFEYPFLTPPAPAPFTGGGGGMAHYLIVSTSEPEAIQRKADFIVNESSAGPELQNIFNGLPTQTPLSLWFAGRFNIGSTDITFPSRAWIRGLGYHLPGSA